MENSDFVSNLFLVSHLIVTECNLAATDLVFVLNASGSISSNKLTTLRALNFVGDIANR